MMNESNNQQNVGKQNDEIDIFEFCSRMWDTFKEFFTAVKELVLTFIIFTLRKTLWIASFALLGVIVGYTYSSLRKPYYTSMLEGNSGGVDNTVVIDHINRLFHMKNKPEILANTIGLSVEQAKQVNYIKAFYGIDVNRDTIPDFIDEFETFNPRDTTQKRVPSVFYIKVALYDEDILSVLRERLFQYINNNAYIQTLYDIDKKQKEELIDDIAKEIAKIDELHLVEINRRTANVEIGQRLYLTGAEPEIRLFYNDILNLRTKMQDLQKSLDLTDKPVVIVQDFIPAQFVEKTSLHYIVKMGLLMSLFGFFFATVWHYRKILWKLIVEDK